jgi:hypothetical protein
VSQLVAIYGMQDPAGLAEATQRIARRLGPQRTALALEAIAARTTPVRNWLLDVSLLMAYWGGEGGRTYHHTAPINTLYGLHESLVALFEEGQQAVFVRHARMHEALVAGLEALGLQMLVAPACPPDIGSGIGGFRLELGQRLARAFDGHQRLDAGFAFESLPHLLAPLGNGTAIDCDLVVCGGCGGLGRGGLRLSRSDHGVSRARHQSNP